MICIDYEEHLGHRVECMECPWRSGWLAEWAQAQRLREAHRRECRTAVVWRELGELSIG